MRSDAIDAIRSELEDISQEFAKLLPEKARLESGVAENGAEIILVEGEPLIFRHEGKYFPTVKGALKIKLDRRFVTVDKGAIPFVAKGVDVMRPGVVAFDEGIKAGELIVINEETHKRALGIGVALWSGEEFKAQSKGKCVKNVHHVGDELWKLGQE